MNWKSFDKVFCLKSDDCKCIDCPYKLTKELKEFAREHKIDLIYSIYSSCEKQNDDAK